MSQNRLIALPIDDDLGLESQVCQHFGHAAAFVVVTVNGDEISGHKVVPNPLAGQHQTGMLPRLVRSTGAQVLLAGGLGARAVAMLESFGIQVATGARGTIRQAIGDYLGGNLGDITPCEHDHSGGCHEGEVN